VFSKLGNPGKWWVVEKKLVLTTITTTTTTHDSRGGPLFSNKSHCLRLLWITLKKMNELNKIASKIVHKKDYSLIIFITLFSAGAQQGAT
jgi:hypothetical protein